MSVPDKAFIENEISKVRDVYIKAPERIVSDYNNEREKVSEYKGRELLEMLQNADDESDSAEDKVAYIRLEDGVLTVANNGNPFSTEGVTSLMYSYLSPKYKRQNKIGSKGTGFRSILSWAKVIHIKSHALSIEFSEASSHSFLRDLMGQYEHIKETVLEKSPVPNPIAVLLTPKWKEVIEDQYSYYDTYVIAELLDSVQQDVQDQINSLGKEILLFLHNLDRIILDSPGRKEIIRKIERPDGKITSRILLPSEEVISERTWSLHARSGEYQGKNYELKVAYTDDLSDQKNTIYSYFRTDVRFPFPALVHGTFELTGNRNQLTRSDVNKHLLDELSQLLIDVATEIAASSGPPSWKALKLLSFDAHFDEVITDLKFEQALLDKIKINRLFPTVSGSYITHAEQPVVFKKDYASLLPPEHFPHLAVHNDDERVGHLLERLTTCIYNAKWFFEKLTSISHVFSLEARAKIISFLLEDYSEALAHQKTPSLLIDDSGDVIPSDAETVLPPEKDRFELPRHVQLRFLNLDLFQRLLRELNVEFARALSAKLALFNVQEYSFATVLRRVIAQTKDQISRNKSKKHKYIKELTRFLWQVFVAEDRPEVIPSSIDVPLLNRYEAMVNASQLYFGKEYGCQSSEDLLKGVSKRLFVGSPKILGLESRDVEVAKRFLSWLGIAEYPRSLPKKFSQQDLQGYAYYVYDQLKYPHDIQGIIFKNAEELKRASYDYQTKIEVETVEYLEQILETAACEDVLLWLIKDPFVVRLMTENSEVNPNSSFAISLYGKQKPRKISYRDISPYILWVCRTKKWIRAQTGQRVEPTVCCLSKNIGPELAPIIQVPDVDYRAKKFLKAKVGREDIDRVLSRLGVAFDLGKFPTDTVYSILMSLPSIDAMGEKARPIYKQMVENKAKEDIDRSDQNYQAFLREGKIFAKKGAQKAYYPVKSVYYIENRTFCQEVINQFPVIDLDKRAGKDKVRALFGVKPLEDVAFRLKGDVVLHPLNERFSPDFEDFKPYVYALRIEKDSNHTQLTALKQSRISLCSHIAASYMHDRVEKDFVVGPYEHLFIEKSNNIYLKLDAESHHSLNDLMRDIKFCETVGEIVSGILKVEENRETISTLYSRDEHQRRETLRTRLDDDELRYLERASELLGVTTDLQKDFWLCVLQGARPFLAIPVFRTDEDLMSLVGKTLGLDKGYVEAVFKDLDYEDLDSHATTQRIIELFRKIKIDVDQYNELTVRTINLKRYHMKCVDDLLNCYQKHYDSYLYMKLKGDTIDQKKTFLASRARYEGFQDYDVDNSVYFDASAFFKDILSRVFNVNNIETQELFDLTEIFRRNKEKLRGIAIQSCNATDSQIDAFLNRPEYRSLVYFGEIDYLKMAFAARYGQQKPQAEEAPKSLQFRGSQISYRTFEGLSTLISGEVEQKDIQVMDIAPSAVTIRKEQAPRRGKRGYRSSVANDLPPRNPSRS